MRDFPSKVPTFQVVLVELFTVKGDGHHPLMVTLLTVKNDTPDPNLITLYTQESDTPDPNRKTVYTLENDTLNRHYFPFIPSTYSTGLAQPSPLRYWAYYTRSPHPRTANPSLIPHFFRLFPFKILQSDYIPFQLVV